MDLLYIYGLFNYLISFIVICVYYSFGESVFRELNNNNCYFIFTMITLFPYKLIHLYLFILIIYKIKLIFNLLMFNLNIRYIFIECIHIYNRMYYVIIIHDSLIIKNIFFN